MPITRPWLTAVLLTLVAGLAPAADQPIRGKKIVLYRVGATTRLLFVSTDPALLFPTVGSADDPAIGSPGGATIELFSPLEPGGVALVAPPGAGNPGWTVREGAVDSARFRNPAAPDPPSPVKRMVLKEGRTVRVLAADPGLALAAPQGSVGIRITTGTLRNCARFDSPTILHDAAGRFVAKNSASSGFTDCSDGAMTGVPSTTATTTTLPGVCGDGTVDPGEACDTTGAGSCPLSPADAGCVPPGKPDECTCCTNGADCGNAGITCCDPDASCEILGMSGFNNHCYDPSCGPGDECATGQSCVGGTCCMPQLGSTCYFQPSGGFIPCCPPAVCYPVVEGGICCLPGGESCVGGVQCCSGSCTGTVCDP